MTPIKRREELAREVAALESLRESTPDDPFAKPLLESRIRSLQEELVKADETIPMPETELIFAGEAVFGSIGIDVKFASHVLHSYQDMLNTHYAAKRHGSVGAQGRRFGEKESRLFLTALPRGSFGLVLAKPYSDDLFSLSHVSEGMEQLAALVEAAAVGDEDFARTVADFHPRVLKSLGRFLYRVASQDTSVSIRAGRKRAALNQEQIREAYKRTVATKVETKTEILNGVFKGVLLESWRFDFLPEHGSVITGLISEEVSEEKAKAMEGLFDKPAKAELVLTCLVTKSGASRPTYVLKSLAPA
jgi:hypothetical protein